MSAKFKRPADEEFVSFEVFSFPHYALTSLRDHRAQPFCFNGMVGFERYRVTVERIKESPDILFERLVELWETSDNFHDAESLKEAAKRLGRSFSASFGSRRERSR